MGEIADQRDKVQKIDSVLFASYRLAMNGHEAVASVLGGTTIVGLTSIFVYGKKKQKENF
jgi:hypothetical protein